jgi:putative inorganic carbon (HCO3(-)) transporter
MGFRLSFWHTEALAPIGKARQDLILLIVAIVAATLIQVSIAASQISLGLGIALLLVFRRKLEFPPIWPQLALFFVITLISVMISPDPWGGRPQIKKFFVFLFIPLIYGVFSTQFDKLYYLMAGWTAAATASGLWGLVQFVTKYQHIKQTGRDFYTAYVERRITGFESHWMTFGALQLSVLALLLAQWCFSSRKMPLWAYGSLAVISTAILLGWTRSIWLATVAAVLYLIWCWRPRMVFLLPVVLLLAYLVAPSTTRERFKSLFEPHGETDSNRHRVVTFRTGIEMVKAHPWFGIGPEQIRRQFDSYVPADITRPLPPGFYGHLHNIYIQYAAERGIPALLVFFWLIGAILWDCLRGLRRLRPGLSQERFIMQGTVACTIGILVGGLFEFNLGDSEVLMMYVTVVALGYAAIKHGRSLPGRELPVVSSPIAGP